MDDTLSLFIKLYGFTTGRRIVTLRKTRKVAVGLRAWPIVMHIDEALAHDSKTSELDLMWLTRRKGRPGAGNLRTVNDLVAAALTGIREGALSLTRGARDDDPVAARANELLARLFPAGVAAVTRLPCAEELAMIEVLLERLQGELAPLVDKLGLGVHVKRLIDLLPEYRMAIENRPTAINFGEVRRARKKGQTYLVELVALILGTFYKSGNPDHIAARTALLDPVMEQQEAIRLHRQGRRPPVSDVDPDIESPDTELPDIEVPDTE